MKIEAYIKADLNAGKASKSIDASTLCDTTVEAEIKGVSYGISPIKNGRNNMSTGELTLETTDNKCIIIKCWHIDDDMADDEFDYRQWSKFDDVIDNHYTRCIITFGRCKNGNPFIKRVERIASEAHNEEKTQD